MNPAEFVAVVVLAWFAAAALLDMLDAAHDACRHARNRRDDAREKADRIARERRILAGEHLHPTVEGRNDRI